MAILAERPNDHIIHMYKDGVEPKYAHTKDEYDNLVNDGYTAERANLPYQRYPLTLYSLEGETVIVRSKVDEDNRIKEGWQTKAVAPKEVTRMAEGESGRKMLNDRLDKNERDIQDMKLALGQILDALKPRKPEPII